MEDGPLRGESRKTERELLAEIASLRGRIAKQQAQVEQTPNPEVQPRAAAYFRILEQAGGVAFEFDSNDRIKRVSPSIQSVLGYTPNEALARPISDWLHEDDRDDLLESLSKLRAGGGTATVTCRLRSKDGGWRRLEITASPYPTDDGKARVAARAQDITAQYEATRELEEAQERFRMVAEMSRDVVLMIWSMEGRLLWASDLSNALGYSVADFDSPEAFSKLLHPDDRDRIYGTGYSQLTKVGDSTSYEPYRIRHKDGSYRWLEGSDRVYQTATGECQTLSVMRNVTRTQQAIQELRKSEERYRIIDELNHDIILLQGDEEGRLLWANAALFDVLGCTKEEVPDAEAFFERVHPDDIDRVATTFGDGYGAVGDTFRYEPYRVRHADGSWRWITGIDKLCENASGERWTISATRDVTEEIQAAQDREKLAQQINETQRLESLGVMAGGIAHDFNNLLTPIVGEASLALLDLPPDSPLRRSLHKIQNAAKRAAALTTQMLVYSGQGPQLIEALDLSDLVQEMGELLESSVPGAVLRYDLTDELPAIEGDASQLSQIVMNLISNAAESIEEGSGHINVRTGVIEACQIDTTHVVGGSTPAGGAHVFIEVTDDGCGMTAETRSKIFDPFFTTKFTGRGLGLASVAGIVRGHGGLIVLDSEVGRGTRFQVLLPASQTKAPASVSAAPRAHWHGDGTVLVVDDDPGVREFAEATLRRAGLAVLLANDGREGLALFRRHADRIRAVVLDRTMPTVGGDTVFEEIRRLHPEMPVILISGYSEEHALHQIGKNLDAFLHKPFEPSALVDTIRRVVEGRANSGSGQQRPAR